MNTIMTVADLKRAIADLPDQMVLWPAVERADGSLGYPAIEAIDVQQGTSGREEDGQPFFKFDGTGPAKFAFVWLKYEYGEPLVRPK